MMIFTLAPNFMTPRIVTGVYNDGLNYDGFTKVCKEQHLRKTWFNWAPTWCFPEAKIAEACGHRVPVADGGVSQRDRLHQDSIDEINDQCDEQDSLVAEIFQRQEECHHARYAHNSRGIIEISKGKISY